ncbi:MAG: hypothetical protein PHX34_05840 [Candidatus Shapirobacteria bacterium]|nr:hypothetical protein [Candidatus Shapirobacteria bacterium]
MVALVSSPFSFDENIGQTFIVIRDINQTALTNITEQVEIIYQDTSNPIFYWFWRDDFIDDMSDVLNRWYGEYQEHDNQALELFNERQDNGTALSQSAVYEIIKYDPKSIEESNELQGFGLRLGSPDKLFIGMLLGGIAIVLVLGIRIFGSGISETSVSVAYKLLVLFLLWGILSTLTYDSFAEIPEGFGIIIWTVLTFMYGIGALTSGFSSGE